MALYLDASAFAKLIVDEPGSGALHELVGGVRPVSSDLLRTELRRAIRRRSARVDEALHISLLSAAEDRMARADLIALTPALLDAAGELQDPAVRSLDAIHVAAALSIADDVELFVTYDRRQAAAAAAAGLPVDQPGP